MFLTKIFQWLISLFSAMKRGYNKLSATEQELSKRASSIISIINTNLNASPETILNLMQLKFPELSIVTISNLLTEAGEVANIFTQGNEKSIDDKILIIQKFLSQNGNIWVYRTQSLVKALITVMLPSTPLEKITIVLEYIYQKLVKKKT